jgi:Flp pilus assembly pilin Flp
MNRIFRFVKCWWPNEEGVTSIEYALVASLIAMVIVVSVDSVGFQVCQRYKTVAEAVSEAMGSSVTVTCS